MWVLKNTKNPISYSEATEWMNDYIKGVAANIKTECIWFLEHPPTYTIGRSGSDKDVLSSSVDRIDSDRGGKVTAHNPGQRVIYFMLNLRMRNWFLSDLLNFIESVTINALREVGLQAYASRDKVGIWVTKKNIPHKIASVGLRVKRGVSSHGIAINVENHLSIFQDIVSCGTPSLAVTSLKKMGVACTMHQFDQLLLAEITKIIGNYETYST